MAQKKKPRNPSTSGRRPAKKSGEPVKKKKKAPLSTTQQDALQKARDQKMTSVSQALKDGKIDHGDIASPEKGVLDPTEFDKFQVETRPKGLTETQRISKIIREHLDRNYSRDGKYEWTVGFFPPNDPNANGANGWQGLTPEAVGKSWSDQLCQEVGLTVWNGALCWNGLGTFERHVICVKTKQLESRQIAAREGAMESMLSQPEQVGNTKHSRMGSLEVTETKKKLPLHAAPEGDDLDDFDEEEFADVAQ